MLSERHATMSEIAIDLEIKGFPNLALRVLEKIIKELTIEVSPRLSYLLSPQYGYSRQDIAVGIESYESNGLYNKISGIEQIRANTRLGLREAKDLYEAIHDKLFWKDC